MQPYVDKDILLEFQEEVQEYLPDIRSGLATLGRNPAQLEPIAEVHRMVHTIKGAAAMIGFDELSKQAADLEDRLEGVAESKERLTPAVVDELSREVDSIEQGVAVALAALDDVAEEPLPAAAPPAQEPEPVVEAPVIEDQALSEELLEVFQEESREHLETVARNLRTLEQEPADREALQEVRRAVHTIKGAAGVVGLMTASRVAHRVEDVLDALYENGRPVNRATLDVLFATSDVLEDLSNAVVSGPELAQRVQSIYAQVDALDAAAAEDVERLGEAVSESEALAERLTEPPMPDDLVDAVADLSVEEPSAEVFEIALDELATEAVAAAPETPTLDDALSAELLETFQEEAEEHLGAVAEHLRLLERDPARRESLQEVRRSIHTIKGAAGVVGLTDANQLAHHCEDLLDRIYDDYARLTPSALQLLHGVVDALDDIAKNKGDHASLATRLQSLHDDVARELTRLDAAPAAPAKPEPVEPEPVATEAIPEPEIEPEIAPASLAEPAEQVDAHRPSLPSEVRPAAASIPEPELTEPEIAAPEIAAPEIAEPALTFAGGAERPEQSARSSQYVRVSLDRVEELIKLVSELMVNRSALDQHYTHYTREVGEMGLSVDRLRRLTTRLETDYTTGQLLDPKSLHRANIPRLTPGVATSSVNDFDELEFDRYTDFHLISRDLTETAVDLASANTQLRGVAGNLHASILRVNRLTSDVQDRLMRLSMSPFSSVENRLHRTVRVTAVKRDRLVDFRVEGSDVELDKGILEDIVAPLEHLLRNAVDHGIEPAEERAAANKPDRGIITIRALLEGSQVSIEVRDDGRGLDPEKLREKAVSSGLYSGSEARGLSTRELYALLFQPGFSTAKEVSDISGRGVGLDIVRATVLGLNGSITIDSEKGFGTTFLIRLPTTMAVTRVLMVESNGHVFAAPAHSVAQVIRVAPSAFERKGDKTVVRHEGRMLDVVSLADALDLDGEPATAEESRPLLSIESGDRLFALAVDQILEGREIVVKTLGGLLRRVPGIAGATTMGDGSVILILNPTELRAPAGPRQRHDDAGAKRKPTVLLADDSLSVRRVLTKVLTANGFEALVAKDGAEAVDMLDAMKTQPDALLLDVEMPRMDGYEVTAAVRAQEEYAGLPIVMLTSRAGDKHRNKAFDLGATDYLVKPFQQDKLLGTLHRVIAESRVSAA